MRFDSVKRAKGQYSSVNGQYSSVRGTEIQFTAVKAGNGVSVCSNMRRGVDDDSLVQAAQPVRHMAGGWIPLLSLEGGLGSGDGADELLVVDGREVGVLSGETVTVIGTASGMVIGAVYDSPTLITVMTDRGPEYIAVRRTGMYWLGAKPAFPEVRFSAEMRGTITATVPAHTLKTINLGSEPPTIGGAEVEVYSDCLTTTYAGLSAMATAGGVWVQPVMACAYYLDSAGRVIHACAPVIVGPATGWQGIDTTTVELTRHSDTSATVGAWQMSLQTYVVNAQVRLTELPAAWRKLVERVAVCVSPQIHPFSCDPEGLMAWRINNPRGGNASLTVALPGATANLASLDRKRLGEVAEIAARMLAHPADEWAMTDFFGSFKEGDHILAPVSRVTPRREWQTLEEMRLKTRSSVTEIRMAELSAPHGFAAACVGEAGVWQLWGNLTPLLSEGLRPCDFGVSDDDVAEEGSSEVSVTDTEGETHRVVARSSVPQLLSPMMLYPHSGATSLTLAMTNAAGATKSREFALTPVAGTTWSIALNANLAAMSPDSFTTYPTAASTVASGPVAMARRTDSVAVTARRSWTRPVSHTTCGHGAVTAITPAYRGGTIADTAKTRACLFATSGIYTASVTSRGLIENPQMIDSRPILSAGHVAYTPDGVYAAGGSELIRVRGNASATMMRDFQPEVMAWHPALNELWYTDPRGNLRLLTLPATCGAGRSKAAFYDSMLGMPYQPVAMTNLGGSLWLTGADTLTQAPDSGSAAAEDASVEWVGRYEFTGAQLPRQITVGMNAANFTGNIELSIDWGGTRFPIMMLAVDGAVEAPVSHPLFLPRNPLNHALMRPFFTISLRGTATGLRLSSIRLD